MTKQLKRQFDLVAFDGMKAVTIFGDEGWTILSGNDKERPDTELYYAARVPIVFRGMEIRADAVANIPFDLVDDQTGDVIDTSDAWENKCGFLPKPSSLLWLIEASWVVSGMSYLYCSANSFSYVKILKPLSPSSIRYSVDKDEFTRFVKTETHSVDKKYPNRIDASGNVVGGESIVPIWKPDPDVEKGPPLKWPGKAALQAMGVLYNLDDAATGFFKRGMLHTTIFAVPPGTQKADKDELEDRIKNMLSGIKNAWRTLFINQKDVTPIDIGGGLESLANVPLTKEKREDVSIALGIPMSILFSETARGLGGKGVVDADDRRLIEVTALPDWRKIADVLNDYIFKPAGYKLVEHHEKMPVFQENESDRSTALGNYVTAYSTDPELANIMAQVLGMKIPDDLQAKLDVIIQRKDEARQKIAEQTQKTMPPTGQTNPVPNDPNAQENTPEMAAQKAALTGELEKYKRKASKRPGEVVDFESAVIPVEMMTAIKAALPECKTAQEVRDVFNKLMVEDQPIRVDWVTELKRANDLLEKSMIGMKFNENHDELGRFSEGSGGGDGGESVSSDSGSGRASSSDGGASLPPTPGNFSMRKQPDGSWKWSDGTEKDKQSSEKPKKPPKSKILPSGEKTIQDNYEDIKQYNYLGIRGLQPDESYEVSDTARNSHDWDTENDVSSDVELSGTSSVSIDNSSLESSSDLIGRINNQMDRISQYGNGIVVLLGGNDAEEGTDQNESIIKNAKVLAILKTKKQ